MIPCSGTARVSHPPIAYPSADHNGDPAACPLCHALTVIARLASRERDENATKR